MPRQLAVADHVPAAELERRFRAAHDLGAGGSRQQVVRGNPAARAGSGERDRHGRVPKDARRARPGREPSPGDRDGPGRNPPRARSTPAPGSYTSRLEPVMNLVR
jgi:hypothetical protein